ncbi:MAG: hypothetical protein HC822_02720 [Oscillochloris sp.]|nr:hypothetical protein [Oscillochloris sp.]
MLLARDDFHLRLYIQAWLREQPRFAAMPQPETDDPRILTAAAALVELLAQRARQEPPAWTATVGALPEPFFAVEWAERPGFTRDLCLNESPEPFKRRNIFAPPNFLEMA